MRGVRTRTLEALGFLTKHDCCSFEIHSASTMFLYVIRLIYSSSFICYCFLCWLFHRCFQNSQKEYESLCWKDILFNLGTWFNVVCKWCSMVCVLYTAIHFIGAVDGHQTLYHKHSSSTLEYSNCISGQSSIFSRPTSTVLSFITIKWSHIP